MTTGNSGRRSLQPHKGDQGVWQCVNGAWETNDDGHLVCPAESYWSMNTYRAFHIEKAYGDCTVTGKWQFRYGGGACPELIVRAVDSRRFYAVRCTLQMNLPSDSEYIMASIWKGHGDGSTVTHSYHFVLQDQFIHSRTRSEFEPKEGEDAGEIHEDLGFFSYDPVRQAIIFRQFLSEGFVNTYVLEPRESDEDPLVFMSESCEGAGNMRARLTIDLDGDDRYTMVLELASPGKKFFACQNLEMKRAQ